MSRTRGSAVRAHAQQTPAAAALGKLTLPELAEPDDALQTPAPEAYNEMEADSTVTVERVPLVHLQIADAAPTAGNDAGSNFKAFRSAARSLQRQPPQRLVQVHDPELTQEQIRHNAQLAR